MNARALLLALIGLACITLPALAGNVYQVTSRQGDKRVSYEVRFGGGKLNDQLTAFDPETKKFVYLSWKRSDARPAPAMQIWDHRTGETIPLYRFPDAKYPLPVIPSLEEMKVCPLTGDKDYKAMLDIIID